jgi:NADH:ubiquinone oxidoreductase subunit 2 (subunit N)
MNWAIALPEIVLSVVAMAILIFGVLRRDETFSFQHVRARRPAARGVAGCHSLRAASATTVTFVADAFSSFVKILILAGAAH